MIGKKILLNLRKVSSLMLIAPVLALSGCSAVNLLNPSEESAKFSSSATMLLDLSSLENEYQTDSIEAVIGLAVSKQELENVDIIVSTSEVEETSLVSIEIAYVNPRLEEGVNKVPFGTVNLEEETVNAEFNVSFFLEKIFTGFESSADIINNFQLIIEMPGVVSDATSDGRIFNSTVQWNQDALLNSDKEQQSLVVASVLDSPSNTTTALIIASVVMLTVAFLAFFAIRFVAKKTKKRKFSRRTRKSKTEKLPTQENKVYKLEETSYRQEEEEHKPFGLQVKMPPLLGNYNEDKSNKK